MLHVNKTCTEHKAWIPALKIRRPLTGGRAVRIRGSISTYRHVPGDELPRLLALLGLSLRWFSTRGDFTVRGPLAMSGDSLVVTTVGRRVLLAPSV